MPFGFHGIDSTNLVNPPAIASEDFLFRLLLFLFPDDYSYSFLKHNEWFHLRKILHQSGVVTGNSYLLQTKKAFI